MKKIYKSIIIRIFKIIHGEINSIYKSKNFEKISLIKNKKKYVIYQITKCRIYTDTIHDTAFLYKNQIIPGASFQIRKNTNSNIKNNSVFKKGTPRILKNITGPLLCILTGGGGNNNYFHWMFDVLPRIGLIEKYFNLNKFKAFLIPSKNFKFQIESLKLLGINDNLFSSKEYKHVYSENVFVTNHPWQHSKSAHSDIENIPRWISKWLRLKFLQYKSNKKFYDRIYIDRSDSKFNGRKIVNEKKLKKFLLEKKFKILKLSSFSFIDQIAIFNSAKIIVGNHGAGFANLVFCKKNTKIVEFVDKNTAKIFKKISKDLKLKYFSILGKRDGIIKKDQNNNLEIDINKLSKIIN